MEIFMGLERSQEVFGGGRWQNNRDRDGGAVWGAFCACDRGSTELSSLDLRSSGLNLDKRTLHVNKIQDILSTSQLINDDAIIT
jgi:hypothetical protein